MPSDNGFLPERAGSLTALEVAKTCPKIPALLPTFVRCGKDGCRCQRGDLHGPYWSLRWREGNVHRRRYVHRTDLAPVRAVIAQRQQERHAERLAFATDLARLQQLDRWCQELMVMNPTEEVIG